MRVKNRSTRLPVIGQIRFGQKVEATNREGKKYTRPASLTTFRFTSLSRSVIDAVAAEYGGEVKPFLEGQGWEVITQRGAITCYLPPDRDMAFGSMMELWSYRKCIRRCDGETELMGTKPRPCLCKKVQERLDGGDKLKKPFDFCKPSVRLKVLLPHLPGTGVWTLDTGSWEALDSFPGVVDFLFDAIPGKPRIDQLEVTLSLKQKKGEKDDKATSFVIPVLTANKSMAELMAAPDLSDAPALPVAVAAVEPESIEAEYQEHEDFYEEEQPEPPEEPVEAVQPPAQAAPRPVEPPAKATPQSRVAALLKKLRLPDYDGDTASFYIPAFGKMIRKPDLAYDNVSEFSWERIQQCLEAIVSGKFKLPAELLEKTEGYDPFAEE